MSGKWSKRRLGKPGAYERGYEAIDWSKGRKPAPPFKTDNEWAALVRDYATKPDWTIPTMNDFLMKQPKRE